ncbi:MAG: hypothetical protein BGO10_09645 [Chlamydia sp. 32-24]|nr:MAG: hypothetical protein BGO10_09645 [Chlamydia sp. 32-24]
MNTINGNLVTNIQKFQEAQAKFFDKLGIIVNNLSKRQFKPTFDNNSVQQPVLKKKPEEKKSPLIEPKYLAGTFQLSFIPEALPVVQKIGSDLQLNYSFESKEIKYLLFVKDILNEAGKSTSSLFLRCTKKIQEKFNQWCKAQFGDDEQNLGEIIDSIHKKVKKYVNLDVKILYPSIEEDEKECQIAASVFTIENRKHGGKAFTLRQVLFLAVAVKAVEEDFNKLHSVKN